VQCRTGSAAHSPTLRQPAERWKITIVLGVLFVAVGIVAIMVPAAASVWRCELPRSVVQVGAIVSCAGEIAACAGLRDRGDQRRILVEREAVWAPRLAEDERAVREALLAG
jgi:uncharacterized membrane protein HdeD (DUF308 family)